MIISQLSIAPIGKGTSLSKYVKIVINCLKKHEIKFVINDMATVIETSDLETLFSVVSKAHQAVIDAGAKRVITELKIDDRRDKNVIISNKINSVK